MHPQLKHEIERKQVLAPVKRWSVNRKVALMGAIVAGYVSFNEARVAHRLTVEELESWWCAYRSHGRAGLKQTMPRTAPPLNRKVDGLADGAA